MTKARDDLMLVLLAQQGDREALDALLQRVQDRLFRYICGILASDTAAAEDALQETLLRIARKLRWLTEPRAFEAWAYRIASNEAYRILRRHRRHLPEEPLDETLPAAETATTKFDAEELRAVVRELSAGSRAVVILHLQEI